MTSPTPAPIQKATKQMAENLTAWRKLRGLTINQLADRAGLSETTVKRLTSSPGSVSLENTLRVARALGILDQLVNAADPLNTDLGRLRSGQQLPDRVRHKQTN